MIPVQTTVIPIFIMYKKIGLMDTRLGIILPLLINPLGIFIMKQFMESIPKSYPWGAILILIGSIVRYNFCRLAI